MNQVPSNYPREGFDDVDEPEIQQIDPRIPANEYTRPRSILPKESVREEKVQTPVFSRNAAGEAESTPPRATPSRNSTSIFGLENVEPPKFETDPYSVKPISMGNSMFDFEPSQQRNQSIHGPSFLGLSDPEFLDDDEEPSHARRNWLLVALLVVVVIGAVQWRNIRDTGMQYAGTLHFKLPVKKGQGSAQVAQEKAAPNDGESSAAGEGKPEMEVNPTTNGAAPASQANNSTDQSKSGQENLLTAQPDQSKKAESANAADSSSKGSPSEAQSKPAAPDKNAADTKALAGKSQKTPDKAQTDSGDDSKVAEARSPDKKLGREGRARKSEPPAPKPNPGSDDVARAISASDPATAANWLWAATKKGNTEAPVLLADYYAKGRGVPKDCEQATVLLRSAARAGNPRASARLGMYYATGQCVAQDRAEAWHWLSVAHEKDPNSDWVEQYRRRLWSEMSPDERARSGSGPTASE
ncbi:MAG TPA: hypothetical protein VFU86_10455 [Terriglobales bacterium]|nr:hypothetical protein [Terriglobales bacterium]